MKTKLVRLGVALVMGALLGVFCIVGVSQRVGFEGNERFILAVWYNRVVIGLCVGLAGGIILPAGRLGVVLRGALLGGLVALGLGLSTDFRDVPAVAAGLVYGAVADVVATWVEGRMRNRTDHGAITAL